jgi:serine/threonine-protein kinase
LNDGSPLVQPETLVGLTLDGRYRLDSLIGMGGMGDVYRATHIHLDTEFAVKLLKPELVANQTAIKRFRLEAKAAGRIHHPNAIRVTDFGVTPERIVYLVMEIVKGRSLRDLMREEGPLDYIRTINIVRQVCGAVDSAHRGGVIHRDLKPDNILIEKINNIERVKVLDFGIAKLKEANPDAFLTQAGTLIGTPQYMSPEQCQGKELDPSSDIYSIGIILYEMLIGEVPFDGKSAIQVVVQQLHDPPRPLNEIAPNVPASIANIVMRTLQKEPDQRPASAVELSDALKQAIELGDRVPTSSFTDQLVARSHPPGTPQPHNSESSIRPEEMKLRFSIDEEQSPPFDRETVYVSRHSAETELAPSKHEVERITRPNEHIPTPGGTPAIEGRMGMPQAERKSRRPLIALAAVVLLSLIGIVVYIMLRPGKVPPAPPPSVTPEGMVMIPGGKFTMGRNDGEPDEAPAHEVEVKSFFLDKYEVTNQAYKKFVDATGHPIPKHWIVDKSYSPNEAEFPIRYVSWEDAVAYARWANKRLPTEEEWEYAARGGSQGLLYPWGNEKQVGYANVDLRDRFEPAPVGMFVKDKSPFGIFDMAGNVSEWVQNFYTEKYGAKPDVNFRIYRGGNALDDPKPNTFRWYDHPRDILDKNKLRVGFRCAKDVDQ